MRPLFWIAASAGPFALILWWLAGLTPSIVESAYSRGVYPALMGPWSRLLGALPFAVGPWLVVALVAGGLSLFFFLPWQRSLSVWGVSASVVLAWFVLGWGLNYQRLSWAASHGETTSGGTVAALEALAETLVEKTNQWHERAATAGAPTGQGRDLASAISRAYERAATSDPLLGGRWGAPKLFPWPELMSRLGISGIFFPFTGEPLVNPGPADWQLPFTAAHEAAHLRGWAREDEANFLAFWVLRNDPNPALAYSAWGSALLYVASALEENPLGARAWARVAAHLDPGVRQDWKRSFAYWDRFRGPVLRAAQAVNDVYLKAQGQTDGVKSYGRMVDLLLAWETRF